MLNTPHTRAAALELDRQDPLSHVLDRFFIPDGMTYLVGHSLGPMSVSAYARLQAAQEAWRSDIVGAWNSAGWIDLAEQVGSKIAPLVGARPTEVVVCDSVSVNLFKLAGAVLSRLNLAKRVIIEDDEFPTDQYIAQGLCDISGCELIKVPSGEGAQAAMAGGVWIKSAVNYKTAEVAPMAEIEVSLSESDCLILWDLSHATGIVPVDLAGSGVKLAVGCTYKYLNGGPGAPAFLYVADDMVDTLRSPLPGWLGHAQPFSFSNDYEPAPGAARFIAGTPSILSLAALDGALDMLDGIKLDDVFAKSKLLSAIVLSRANEIGMQHLIPSHADRRGGHVCLCHDHAYPVSQALAHAGIKSDFRPANIIRFGLSPLYNSYTQIWDVMELLGDILDKGLWDRPEFKVQKKVT